MEEQQDQGAAPGGDSARRDSRRKKRHDISSTQFISEYVAAFLATGKRPQLDSPRSPPSSESSSEYSPSNTSRCPEVSSEYSDQGTMENSNAFLQGHHFAQMVDLMKHKYQHILDYETTKNSKIVHLDWVVGNPSDPANMESTASSSGAGGMSFQDRMLSNSVARSVMRITHGLDEWDEKMTWNKSMFFGDWLSNERGQRQFYFEIQVKRIPGSDDALLEQCGIHPKYVWLGLHDDKAPAIDPVGFPPLPRTAVSTLAAARRDPIPREPVSEAVAEVQQEESTSLAPAPSLQVPSTSADKGKGKAVPMPQAAGNDSVPRAGLEITRQAVTPASSPAPQVEPQTSLPNLSNLGLSSPKAASTNPAGPSAALRTGIPRSQPLPSTGSFDMVTASEPDNNGSTGSTGSTDSSDESLQDEGSVYLAEGADPFRILVPAHQTLALSAADLHAHREHFDRSCQAKLEELSRIFAFQRTPEFTARKLNSFVYAVRVIAIPDIGNVTNVFTGPPVPDRYGTLLASGGWVVPPLEERVQWRNEHQRAYRNKGAKPGKYEGLPAGTVNRAMPVRFDWSGNVPARYFGLPAPMWREVSEPCLEDVYWMVWQLLGGKQFVGFQPGTGFGVHRAGATGEPAILGDCPFKSPSREALYHAASYPRVDETKKKN